MNQAPEPVSPMSDPSASDHAPRAKAYLVGGGIASMAAAAFLIRDGDMRGCDITIIEEMERLGGSLDGAGTAADGYVLRGGRMIESKYLCTFDLFASIPTLDGKTTVTQEIFDWNQTLQTSSKSRLVRNGQRVTNPALGLSERNILTIERLAIEPEHLLGVTTIADQFDATFFRTDFWMMWCTTFAFQPWHSAVEFKRYLVRFVHMISGFGRLEGIMRTFYNQYDSMVRPLQKWLEERGVNFAFATTVSDLAITSRGGRKTVEQIVCGHGDKTRKIALGPQDLVMITLGSMTAGSRFGTMDAAPELVATPKGGTWLLWENLAEGRSEFGRPAAFDSDVDRSKWTSFTITLHDPTFLRLVRDFTGNVPGEGGLITFAQSNWLASIVIPHQPHFIGQPEGVEVCWGYGLTVDAPGNFVGKPMSACSGREIMTEILGHLGIVEEAPGILASSICIPCMMPYITSQFMPRAIGDRPQVIPQDYGNLALLGQYCEMKDDVVFTVEYSIRSAQTAVYALLGLDRKPPAVYQGKFDARVLAQAFLTLHGAGHERTTQVAQA
jgi:oleate hydratase